MFYSTTRGDLMDDATPQKSLRLDHSIRHWSPCTRSGLPLSDCRKDLRATKLYAESMYDYQDLDVDAQVVVNV